MENVPKIVRARMRQSRLVMTAVPQNHPDADLLSAFSERSLTETERDRVVDHLAQCGDCRQVIALALPESEAPQAVPASTERGGWLRWPVLRWGVVAAGILLFTSVGVMEYRQRHQPDHALISQVETRNEKVNAPNEKVGVAVPAAPPSAQSTVAIESAPQATMQEPVKGQTRTRVEAQKAGRAVGIGGGSGAGYGMLAKKAPRPAARGQQPGVPPGAEVVEVQSNAGVVGTQDSAPSSQNEPVQNADSSQDRGVTTSDIVGKAKDPVPAVTAGLVSPDVLQGTSSPKLNAAALWTISSAGVLQRSFDSGQTWQEVNVNSTSITVNPGNPDARKYQGKAPTEANTHPVFRVVSANGSEVWAGGSVAALYHSIDYGNRWTRVLPSTAGVALAGDVTRIDFTDPQHGQIVTSSGETWTTADDGQSWQRK